MMSWEQDLQQRREWCWNYGVHHRERLVETYMAQRGLKKRPFLADIIDELIEDIQEARLVEAVLPLDRFAQTERCGGRVVVTINSRIDQIPGVKDAAGVAYEAKWHESLHIDRDMGRPAPPAPWLKAPSGAALQPVATVVCRSMGRKGTLAEREREFIAETAGLAASIAGADLERCSSFREFQCRTADGGDLGWIGWELMRRTAMFLGVNRSALVKYLQQRGLIRIVERDGARRLIASPQRVQGPGGFEWARLD